MKDDITPIEPEEQGQLKPPFMIKKKRPKRKKPQPQKITPTAKSVPKPKQEARNKPKVDNLEERQNQELRKQRREQLKQQEKLNKRGDLVFLWVLISIMVIGSALILGYYYLQKRNNSQPAVEKAGEETNTGVAEIPKGQQNYFLYLSANEDRVAIYKDYDGVQSRETIVAFTPTVQISDSDAAWDNDHKYAFVDVKGVEVYNSEKKSKTVVAPNQGNREYFKVEFSSKGEIGTAYRLENKNYLELYTSAYRKQGKNKRITDFTFTNSGQPAYIFSDTIKKNFLFRQYSRKEGDYLPYFEAYFGTTRYPLSFAYSPKNDSAAFLLRDNSGNKAKIILAIGDLETGKISKISELLFLDLTTKDDAIIRPTIVWDKKEDFIYASVNNQMFKIDLTSNEAKELNLGFSGTVEHISDDNKLLYIRKANQSITINEPESVLIYDLTTSKVEYTSSLSEIVRFIGFYTFKSN